MSAAAAAAAASRRRQRELVAAFAAAGAVDAVHARTIDEIGMRDRLRALRQLRDHGVLHLAGSERYWVDLPAWESVRQRRKRLVLIIALIAFVIGLIASGALAAWLPGIAR